MDQAVGTARGFDPTSLASPVMDAVMLAAWYWLIPPLAGHLANPHWSHPIVITAAYLAMCAGVSMAKRIKAPPRQPEADQEENPGMTSGCALGLAIPFAIFVITLAIITSGVLEDKTPWLAAVKELPGGDAVLSVLGILGFILILGLFPAVLVGQPGATIQSGSARAILTRILALFLGNTMVLVTAAYWQGQLADAEPMGLAIGGRILVFILVYAVFLMFYLPPRLAVAVIEGNRNSIWSLLAALALIVWPLTA